ncbi:MAG: dihydroorotase [Phycisphaerales bacterium]|nr:dihydroorotase [Phycisphaerales bacterium]
MTTLLLRGGRVIDPASGHDATADVLIENGCVTSVSPTPMEAASCSEVIDCEGHIVCPGLIDTHVHFREPSGDGHEETIASGAAAAAAGGFTTVCTMPNTTPAVDSPAAVAEAIELGRAASSCRVLPVAAATLGREGRTIAPIPAMAEAGAVGFSDDGVVIRGEQMMAAVLAAAANVDRCVMQHCQDPAMTGDGVIHPGEVQRDLDLVPWPPEAEHSIIERDLRLNADIGCAWHGQHISSGDSVAIIRRAQQAGQRATGEASPHHLLLTTEAIPTHGTAAKMNPPLRDQSDIDAIKEGIAEGTITVLATDHAPHPQESKDRPFSNASFGIVGLECALPLYAKALIHEGPLDWPGMLAMMTCNGADLIGRPDLGRLQVGCTADITVINPTETWTIDAAGFQSAGRNCPFDGWNVSGRAVTTVLGGQIRREGV